MRLGEVEFGWIGYSSVMLRTAKPGCTGGVSTITPHSDDSTWYSQIGERLGFGLGLGLG